jgi:hypothetical protein
MGTMRRVFPLLFLCLSHSCVESLSTEKHVVVPVLPDLFVEAAPLVAALACRDGVALLVVHNLEEEPSLSDDDCKEDVRVNDIPEQYAGPLRIHPITSATNVMLPCGWRADGDSLVRRAREICNEHYELLGEEMKPHHLCWNLSLRLASQAVYARSQSCAALLASVQDGQPRLWLLDATGSYPMIAHCLGGGSIYDKENKQTVMVANILQRQMESWVRQKHNNQAQQQQRRKPYLDVSARTGLQMLLSVFNDEHNNNSDEKESSITVDLRKRRIELAILDASENRLLRIYSTQLANLHSNKQLKKK